MPIHENRLPLLIRSMVQEAIRDLRKPAARKFPAKTPSFSLEILSSLPTYEERLAYCHAQGLKLLGEGTARTVFLLDNTSVLKLAINEAGRDQNEMEAKVKDCTSIKAVFAKIFKVGPNYDWIVMERVKQVLQRQLRVIVCLGNLGTYIQGQTLGYFRSLSLDGSPLKASSEPSRTHLGPGVGCQPAPR